MRTIIEQLKDTFYVEGKVPSTKKGIVVGGMGGSRLPAEFFRAMFPALSVQVWKSYGLPPEAAKDALYIASSYSGNTKETLSFFDEAHTNGMKLAVITGGGELLSRAQSLSVPHMQIPWHKDTPARRMLPTMLCALSRMAIKTDELVRAGFANLEHAGTYERGALLSGSVPVGSTPVFYASERNAIIAEYAKIEASETAHIPAYASTFPEFLHNELAGFACLPVGMASENTHITPIFFFDLEDDARATKDARHVMRFLEKKGYAPVAVELGGEGRIALLAEACVLIQGMGDALLRDRMPTPDFMREFRKER